MGTHLYFIYSRLIILHFISCIVVMQAVYFIVHYTHSITKNCSEMPLYCQSCTLLAVKHVVYLVWARLRLELIPIRIEVSFLQCDWTGGNEQNGCECICPASFSSSHLFLCFGLTNLHSDPNHIPYFGIKFQLESPKTYDNMTGVWFL